jgi:hypothetical protein
MTEKTRPVSTRLTLEEFAKVRDCLIEQGVPENQLMTNSNIVKTALLITIVNSFDSKSDASSESTDIIRQLWKVKRS